MDTAIYTWITELLNGTLVSHEEQASSILLASNVRASKVRIFGIAVSINELVVDDGTGSILVRAFEKPPFVTIGDPILVIGRPRIHGNQPYILGEIVKKINPLWLTYRQKIHPLQRIETKSRVIELVRTLDRGDGADFNDVVNQLGGTEELIITLLANGELFETRPGKLKVLE